MKSIIVEANEKIFEKLKDYFSKEEKEKKKKRGWPLILRIAVTLKMLGIEPTPVKIDMYRKALLRLERGLSEETKFFRTISLDDFKADGSYIRQYIRNRTKEINDMLALIKLTLIEGYEKTGKGIQGIISLRRKRRRITLIPKVYKIVFKSGGRVIGEINFIDEKVFLIFAMQSSASIFSDILALTYNLFRKDVVDLIVYPPDIYEIYAKVYSGKLKEKVFFNSVKSKIKEYKDKSKEVANNIASISDIYWNVIDKFLEKLKFADVSYISFLRKIPHLISETLISKADFPRIIQKIMKLTFDLIRMNKSSDFDAVKEFLERLDVFASKILLMKIILAYRLMEHIKGKDDLMSNLKYGLLVARILFTDRDEKFLVNIRRCFLKSLIDQVIDLKKFVSLLSEDESKARSIIEKALLISEEYKLSDREIYSYLLAKICVSMKIFLQDKKDERYSKYFAEMKCSKLVKKMFKLFPTDERAYILSKIELE